MNEQTIARISVQPRGGTMPDHDSGPIDIQQTYDPFPGPAPWWVRAIQNLGLPTVYALGTAFVLYTILTGDLSAWKKQQDEIKALLVQHVNDTLSDQRETRFYLRQICINSAKDEYQRAGCIAPETAR